MKNLFGKTLMLCALLMLLVIPAFAAVTVVNTLPENLNIDIVSGKDTMHTTIGPNATSKVGGSGSTTVVVLGNDGKELAKGSFYSGEKAFISKTAKGYKIAKPAAPKPSPKPTVAAPKVPETPRATVAPKTTTAPKTTAAPKTTTTCKPTAKPVTKTTPKAPATPKATTAPKK